MQQKDMFDQIPRGDPQKFVLPPSQRTTVNFSRKLPWTLLKVLDTCWPYPVRCLRYWTSWRQHESSFFWVVETNSKLYINRYIFYNHPEVDVTITNRKNFSRVLKIEIGWNWNIFYIPWWISTCTVLESSLRGRNHEKKSMPKNTEELFFLGISLQFLWK